MQRIPTISSPAKPALTPIPSTQRRERGEGGDLRSACGRGRETRAECGGPYRGKKARDTFCPDVALREDSDLQGV